MSYTDRGRLLIEIQCRQLQTGCIAIDKIVVQRDKGIQQVAVQAWKIDQGADGVGDAIEVIQTLDVGQLVRRVDLHIIERRSALPGHDGGRGRAVQLGVVHATVACHQSDGNRHDGRAQAAYFDPILVHCLALGAGLLRGLHLPHGIIEPDTFVDPLLEEPAQLAATCRFCGMARILAGDRRPSSHQQR